METPNNKKNMEEIKLPKFKTKEELEQFAMGLMTENESLREIIKLKDSSIEKMSSEIVDSICKNEIRDKTLKCMKGIVNERDKYIRELEPEIKSLKEKESENYYKGLYEKESDYHADTRKKGMDYQHKFEESKKMVHELLSMVIFMYGLLNRFQAKRVVHEFGEFDAAEYRL